MLADRTASLDRRGIAAIGPRLRALLFAVVIASCDSGRPRTHCQRTNECLAIAGAGTPVAREASFPSYGTYLAPVPEPSQISSTFGPRWKASANRDDFHPGIDFYDALGTEVFAIGAGTVVGVHPDGSSQFPNGGNVLVIEHALPAPTTFHDRTVTRFFAVYLHLDSFAVAIDDAVSAGETIGTMGMTGDTDFVHLHFETRVETICSLPFQTSNPSSSCATGFDPHVHPMHFFDAPNADAIVLEEIPTEGEVVVRYTASRDDLDLDVIETDFGVLAFDERRGMDATSLARLDDFDFGWVRLVPQPFVSASESLVIDLHFPQRPAFLEVRDFHGVGVRY